MSHKQNYAAKTEQNRLNRLATGLLSDRFPNVSTIVIQMTYYQKGANPVLMLRTVNIVPANFAYFNMECVIKDCTGGGFDLSPVIAGMIKTRKKAGKGKLVCRGKIDSKASDHSNIDYDITILYNKNSRK